MSGIQALAKQASLGGATSQPLTAHPYFTPALVAWFAALFGLSVAALPGSLIESWVLSAQLDLIVPAAAPPLGLKARLIFALAFALIGGGLGWLVARLTRPARAAEADGSLLRRSRDSHPDHPARRPISAHAELGDEGLGRADTSSFFDETPVFAAATASYPTETFRSAYAEVPALAEPAQPQAFAVELPPAAPFTDDPFLESFAQASAPAPAPEAELPMPDLALPELALPELATPDLPVFAAMPVIEEERSGALASFLPPLAQPVAYPPPPPAAPVSETPSVPYPAPAWDVEPAEPVAESAEHDIPVITPFPLIGAEPHEPVQEHEAEEPWHALPPLMSESDLAHQAAISREPVPALLPLASVTPIRPLHLATLADLPEAAEAGPEAGEDTPEPAAMIGATPVQPRAHAEERIGQAALDDLSHVELIERLALAMQKRETPPTTPGESPAPLPLRPSLAQARAALPQIAAQIEDMAGTQASLRSALAALREVK